MPWIPIHESDLTYTFSSPNDVVSFNNSIASTSYPSAIEANWTVDGLVETQLFRITCQSSDSLGSQYPNNLARFYWGEEGNQENTSPPDGDNLVNSWAPLVFETDEPSTYIQYQQRNAESFDGAFEFLVEVWVEDSASVSLPWWYCTPKEPVTPCPIRATTFIPFAEYDAEFKYPLKSSRVPSKVLGSDLDEGCPTCSPNLVGVVVVEPEPIVCAELATSDGGSNSIIYPQDLSSMPAWFIPESNFSIDYASDENLTVYSWVGGSYTISSGSVQYGPQSGVGIFTQGSNSICINWHIGSGF